MKRLILVALFFLFLFIVGVFIAIFSIDTFFSAEDTIETVQISTSLIFQVLKL